MKNEQTAKELTVADSILTDAQTEQVAGGLSVAVLRAGCPGCTSGGFLAFQNLVNIVNPAPQIMG